MSSANEDDKNKSHSLEVIGAVVLASAALATAYASYQSELWDGEQAAHYAEANSLRVESTRASLRAGQLEGADLMTFGSWLSAYASREETLEDFYRRRFRPEFSHVFEAWIATRPALNPNAPPTPFAMPGYKLPEREEAYRLEQQSHEAYETGQRANQISDSFVLATVIFANALFFGGINQIPRGLLTRRILLGVSVASCVLGIVQIAMLPPAP